ncbi:type II toxin-antitoxin system VapC family toxin [Candidatus Palauibacter sp.]|uniref:type II toxin-antitoxin system VapC family toxin n=1 Tax=Candidatus Palauibacter sp. TaxID=3101350 RepID=UPI003B59925C
MIAVDTNILVYAHRRESPLHESARNMLRTLTEGDLAWAIPWPCLYEFLGVVTNRRIWRNAATPPDRAWAQLRAWTESPSNRLLGETDGFLDLLERLITRQRVRGPLVHDARVAAICLAHGVEALLTRDRDFALFPELVTLDPWERRERVLLSRKGFALVADLVRRPPEPTDELVELMRGDPGEEAPDD